MVEFLVVVQAVVGSNPIDHPKSVFLKMNDFVSRSF